MDKTNLIIFFLQTLHYRDDLETSLFKNLYNIDELLIDEASLNNLYGQKVHPELIKNTIKILESFGVLQQQEGKLLVNKVLLKEFNQLTDVAKAARDYKWPTNRPKPFLFVSPPSIITSELSGDIDDISNLLINLVRSAKKSIMITSPFTNKEGISSILSPLKACKTNPEITLYLTATESDQKMIFRQVLNQIPNNMKETLKVFFCSPEKVKGSDLPHAKLLIVDSFRGYLGSANFTSQGLNSRFELGVELDEKQSKTIENLLKILVEKKVFSAYKDS